MTEGKPRDVTSRALAWLDARPEAPPADLRQRMAEALAGVTAETVPGALAEGALSCLQATIAAPQERATALDLLAADALLTYALEAAAEIGALAIKELTEAYGPGALAEVLPEDAGAGGPAGETPVAPPTEVAPEAERSEPSSEDA